MNASKARKGAVMGWTWGTKDDAAREWLGGRGVTMIDRTARQKMIAERAAWLQQWAGRGRWVCWLAVWWAQRGLSNSESRYLLLASVAMADLRASRSGVLGLWRGRQEGGRL